MGANENDRNNKIQFQEKHVYKFKLMPFINGKPVDKRECDHSLKSTFVFDFRLDQGYNIPRYLRLKWNTLKPLLFSQNFYHFFPTFFQLLKIHNLIYVIDEGCIIIRKKYCICFFHVSQFTRNIRKTILRESCNEVF